MYLRAEYSLGLFSVLVSRTVQEIVMYVRDNKRFMMFLFVTCLAKLEKDSVILLFQITGFGSWGNTIRF